MKTFFVQFFSIFLPLFLNLLLLGPYCFCLSCMKCSLGISNFHKEIFSLPILLFSSLSLHCSLKKSFLSFLAIYWNSAFRWICLSFSSLSFTSLLFITICKSFSDNHFIFCLSLSWGQFWSPSVQCYELPSIALQTLYQI